MYKEFGKEYLMAQMMKNGVMGMGRKVQRLKDGPDGQAISDAGDK